MAQQVVQRRQSGGRTIAMVAQGLSWSPNGGKVVASDRSMDAIGRPKKARWWYTSDADSLLKLIQNVNNSTLLWATNGRPLCIPSTTTALCVPFPCPLWATCERPTSSATFVRLFWTCSKLHEDYGVRGEVWTSSVPPLNDQGNLSASLVPSTATWPVLWSHKGGTKVAVPL